MKLPGSMQCGYCRKMVEVTWIKTYGRYLAYCCNCHFAIDARQNHSLDQHLQLLRPHLLRGTSSYRSKH
ncbi:MAG: hypothetical protein OEY99_01605 [Aigarchaeota archaeon]|nr:hypothetical protein [Aigarchaeota archaeon]